MSVMGGSFDDKGSGPDAAGKRPTPTIEGTATEVAVEPDADEAAASEGRRQRRRRTGGPGAADRRW